MSGSGQVELPYISAELPGVGGVLKSTPEHFVVEEIPLYAPSGDGPHLYLTVRRQGLTTRQMVDELAKAYDVPAASIGYSGLKDKEALTTQTFSLATNMDDQEARGRSVGAAWELLSLSRHRNKLKVGHLLGNRFTIILSGPNGSISEAKAIAEKLRSEGVLNYFGAQRFGKDGDNMALGLKFLKSGRKARSWKDKFLLSSLQSFIYNHYLGERVNRGLFPVVMTGDICKKYETGGIFTSENGQAETARFRQGELSHTGPIFGAKTKRAEGEAGEFEVSILAGLGLSEEEMAGAGSGDRRINRLLVPDLSVEEVAEGFCFSFALPKGAYATSVLREFIKGEQPAAAGD
ncbi:tRNA pseudouridine(13) synthase TruD [Deltaproteobacteria bacterium Smac51]|nr:tRNA pseudouridine(13) synthase TruD [Deltaproteobacteria bacterium Smac51]